MPRASPAIIAVRVLTAVAVALAAMCVWLAAAWTDAREEAACWRAAAEFQLQPEGDCT